jgi:hypothetical protein
LVQIRARRAAKANERFEVSREIGSKASNKFKGRIDGPTRAGLKYAARRIRTFAPSASLGDICLVLNVAFDVDIDKKDVENWTQGVDGTI